MKNIDIKISGKQSYHVQIGRSVFKNLVKLINQSVSYSNILAVIDKQVYKYHHNIIDETLGKLTNTVITVQLKSSEKLKTNESLSKIYSALQRNNFTRDTLLLAIGGGIVGDITGYAAATYNRGVKYAQIPTTLLAAVDSSVGGKTGINFGEIKNSIGAFYQPDFVLADPTFFSSLPRGEILSGLGEIIKYGFLADEKFYSFVFSNIDTIFELKNSVIEKVIFNSINFKRDVVVIDEKESGTRKILNLGHTFAHAVESGQNYKTKHGEAVIAGIACSLFMSNKIGLLTDDKLQKYISAIQKLSGNIHIKKINKRLILNAMKRDKKNLENKIKFVLLHDIGKIAVDVEADNKLINYALEKGLKIFS